MAIATCPSLPGVGLCAQLACLWETTARNPGNVHRYRDFDDVSYVDFLASAAAVAPVFDVAAGCRLGETVHTALRATRSVTSNNTNLGIILLLAPLAVVPRSEPLRTGVASVLATLDIDDARLVFEAIRLAAPAGLGTVANQDLASVPTLPLKQVMALSANYDLIARQYAVDFADVFDQVVPALQRWLALPLPLEEVLVGCHLDVMTQYPDSLIARKRGQGEAVDASRRAGAVLKAGWPSSVAGKQGLIDLDKWLRAAQRGRNPGTTSDLVTASLFIALREGIIPLPVSRPLGFSVP